MSYYLTATNRVVTIIEVKATGDKSSSAITVVEDWQKEQASGIYAVRRKKSLRHKRRGRPLPVCVNDSILKEEAGNAGERPVSNKDTGGDWLCNKAP